MSEKRSTELAEDRTDWAEDRTILAGERTFAGWMRTGLASAGLGLGFQAVFKETEPTWMAKAGATVFLAIAIFIFMVAYRKAKELVERMEKHASEPMGPGYMGLLCAFFSSGTVVLGVILWML